MSAESFTISDELMKPRKRWIVLLLALLTGPFVLVYCGRLRRAVAWGAGLTVIGGILLAAALYYPFGEISFLLGLAIIGASYLLLLVDALRISKQTIEKSYRPYQRWWAYLLIILLFYVVQVFVSASFRNNVAEAFFLPSGGMKSTLMPGDRFCLFKFRFSPRKGQVVAFITPDPRAEGTIYVKRIVALAGENVRIENDNLYINDIAIDEPYVTIDEGLRRENNQFAPDLSNFEWLRVPDDHVFLLGDNRLGSLDSRSFGCVPVQNLIGEARVVFWSREYEREHPSREKPQGKEKWGAIRWERLGMRVE